MLNISKLINSCQGFEQNEQNLDKSIFVFFLIVGLLKKDFFIWEAGNLVVAEGVSNSFVKLGNVKRRRCFKIRILGSAQGNIYKVGAETF